MFLRNGHVMIHSSNLRSGSYTSQLFVKENLSHETVDRDKLDVKTIQCCS